MKLSITLLRLSRILRAFLPGANQGGTDIYER